RRGYVPRGRWLSRTALPPRAPGTGLAVLRAVAERHRFRGAGAGRGLRRVSRGPPEPDDPARAPGGVRLPGPGLARGLRSAAPAGHARPPGGRGDAPAARLAEPSWPHVAHRRALRAR